MSIALAPTTELDAVNELIATIGEAPVNQLNNLGLSDAAVARDRLYDSSRRIQKIGWSWNTDWNFQLATDINGNVWLPANALKVTFTGTSADKGYVQRGNQLYDAVNHTLVFSAPVTANIVTMLPWTSLPESARQAIFHAAGIRFQSGRLGSEILDKFIREDMQASWAELWSEELEVLDPNMFSDSAHMREALNRISTGNVGYPDWGF